MKLVRSNSMLPSVFDWAELSKVFEEVNKDLFTFPAADYPTDIVEICNNEGKAEAIEVTVALADVPRENIKIDVKNDTLMINVEKTVREDDPKRVYLRRSISHRSMKLPIGLHGVDQEKINAKFENGTLKVTLPLAVEKVKEISIG